MITYYYKDRVEHEDFLNHYVLKTVIFGVCLLYFVAALVLGQNYGTVSNNIFFELKYVTEFVNNFKMWSLSNLNIAIASIFFVAILILQ